MRTLLRMPGHARAALLSFFALESAAGVLLVAAALLAMITANSPLAEWYQRALAHSFGIDLGIAGLRFEHTALAWINDALMAVFFLLVGLELKRETQEGQLAQRGDLALPLLCALGGMLVPMCIYFAVNHGDPLGMRGVAIPAATDIAFALGILTLLGPRVPLALKLLLTAIAVLDDVGAIVIIAVFYTDTLSTPALLLAGAVLLSLIALSRAGVMRLWPYLVLGVILWGAVAHSGVHATLAGVALGFIVPLRKRVRNGDPTHLLQASGADGVISSPLLRLEHRLHPWVAYGILPIFAFANAGMPLANVDWTLLGQPVPLGVMLGLVIGKPLGVMLGLGVAGLTPLARLPADVDVASLFGMSLLCGIGFTMSLFINHLAFAGVAPALAASAKLAVVLASLVTAVLGFAWLRWSLARGQR